MYLERRERCRARNERERWWGGGVDSVEWPLEFCAPQLLVRWSVTLYVTSRSACGWLFSVLPLTALALWLPPAQRALGRYVHRELIIHELNMKLLVGIRIDY